VRGAAATAGEVIGDDADGDDGTTASGSTVCGGIIGAGFPGRIICLCCVKAGGIGGMKCPPAHIGVAGIALEAGGMATGGGIEVPPAYVVVSGIAGGMIWYCIVAAGDIGGMKCPPAHIGVIGISLEADGVAAGGGMKVRPAPVGVEGTVPGLRPAPGGVGGTDPGTRHRKRGARQHGQNNITMMATMFVLEQKWLRMQCTNIKLGVVIRNAMPCIPAVQQLLSGMFQC
jgi:hypothetical protein